MTTVAVAVTLALSSLRRTIHVYTPEAFLKTFGTLYTPRTVETGIPLGSRTWKVVISGIFLVRQVIFNNSPSLTVASPNKGSLRTAEIIIILMLI